MNQDTFAQEMAELLSPFGTMRIRKMFGGYGIYANGLMMALIAYDKLYFKANAAAKNYFEQCGSQPFVYEAHGKRATMSYWQAPEDLADDHQELKKWFDLAYAAAVEQKNKKRAT